MDPQTDVSKTQRKREMLALQKLGEKLVAMPLEQLANLKLPDALRHAILEARRFNQRGARRRQLQYIGRLMRDVDAVDIGEQLDASQSGSVKDAALLHRAERWRARLLSEENSISEFINEFPGTDVQKLRTMLRNAKHEATIDKPPKVFRELFREIRETISKND